jgi:hypothetical protein
MEKLSAFPLPIISLLISLLLPAAAYCDECTGLYKQAADQPNADFFEKLRQIKKDLAPSNCGSSFTVASQVLGKDKGGHLKLEDDKPFNLAQAQANLDAALKDPAVQEALSEARAQITDENNWLYYEATIFDAEGYYDARNLIVRQLQQNLNVKTK